MCRPPFRSSPTSFEDDALGHEHRASQFRPAPPPALNSEVWTRDLNEIREIGSNTSTRRTAEQTTTARFWFFTGPRTYNPIVRQVALARKMDIEDCARLYALSSIAGVDAFIAVFDGKYTYNLWRPVTAIRNADLTSNPATPREASWLPLGTTPMHPEYPCAHCIVAAAVSTVLQTGRRQRGRRDHAGQPDRSRRHPQMDASAGLQRRGFECPNPCRVPLPLFHRGREGHGKEDR